MKYGSGPSAERTSSRRSHAACRKPFDNSIARRIGRVMKSNGWALAAMLVLLCGCSRQETAATSQKAAANGERRFPLTGEVIRVDAGRNVLVIRHDEVKGLMPAMTMEFKAGAGDIAL